jgi:hypothetical protein
LQTIHAAIPVAFTLYMSSMLALSTLLLQIRSQAWILYGCLLKVSERNGKGTELLVTGRDDYEGTEVAALGIRRINLLIHIRRLSSPHAIIIKDSGDKEWAESITPL